MQQLPEEIVIMLLPLVGGHGFVSLRRTCWQLKEICDRAEIAPKPVLWSRYVSEDFPRPIIESVTPWLDLTCQAEEATWKELYIRLSIVKHLQNGANYLDSRLNIENIHYFSNACFLNGQLFVTDSGTGEVSVVKNINSLENSRVFSEGDYELIDQPVKLADAYKEVSNSGVFKCQTEEQAETMLKQLCTSPIETVFCNFGCKGFSSWSNLSIEYHKLDPFGQDRLEIRNTETNSSEVIVDLGRPFPLVKQIVFNGNQIAILFDKAIYVFPIKWTEPSYNVKQTLPINARKIHMLSNVLIVLLANGCLVTVDIIHHAESGLTLGEPRPLVLHDDMVEEQGLLAHQIKDFVIHGPVFAAVSNLGNIYLSIFDSCDHDSIERNFMAPHKIKMRNGGTLTRVAVALEHGLQLALLEQVYNGTFWSSIVHLVYVKRDSQLEAG